MAPTADDWLIVDCLLPPQVRQLGTRVTYLSARRAVKTSARDCAIRGGEYVRQDAADRRSALAVWLPAAEEGDTEAQINVGTIYERGLGQAPDYAKAGSWYRRAAEAGSAQAQLKLSALYESGLGVPADLEEARRLYRQASGGAPPVLVPPPAAPDPALVAEIGALNGQLVSLQDENRALRADLQAANRSLSAAGQLEADRRLAIEAQIELLAGQLQDREARLSVLEQQLDEARDNLSIARDSTATREAALAQQQAQAQQQAAAALEQLGVTSNDLTALQERLAERERTLADEARRADELEQQLSAVRQQAEVARSAALAAEADPEALAPPQLTLIDPNAPATRGLVKVSVPVLHDVHRVIGRVTAPAGLLSLTVNGVPTEPNGAGVFTSDVSGSGAPLPVAIVAVDQRGNRASIDLVYEPGSAAQPEPVGFGQSAWSGLPFGRYHALVIGNNHYQHLPALNSAIADADAISRVLEQRYGFEVTRLTNATRYEILSALNTLRESLTTEDNLLIYYAGHGELDRVNMRGHWLPVDAEPGNNANWISNVAITDILNASAARQVLLLADSCYSGSLTRSGLTQLKVARTDAEERTWIRAMLERRSRLALTSGGLAPVLDAGGGQHSVFAAALIDVLENNEALLDSADLYEQVAARVAYQAANMRFEQIPEFAPIRHAGHEAGEFFLVPRS